MIAKIDGDDTSGRVVRIDAIPKAIAEARGGTPGIRLILSVEGRADNPTVMLRDITRAQVQAIKPPAGGGEAGQFRIRRYDITNPEFDLGNMVKRAAHEREQPRPLGEGITRSGWNRTRGVIRTRRDFEVAVGRSDPHRDSIWDIVKSRKDDSIVATDVADALSGVRDYLKEMIKRTDRPNVPASIERLGQMRRDTLALVEKMLDVGKHLSRVPFDLMKKTSSGVRGEYLSDVGVVQARGIDTSPWDISGTIVHEGLHALTMPYLTRMPRETQIYLQRLYRAAKEEVNAAYAGDAARSYYGFENARELLAELSNPNFRSLLKNEAGPGTYQDVEGLAMELGGIDREALSKMPVNRSQIGVTLSEGIPEIMPDVWKVRDRISGRGFGLIYKDPSQRSVIRLSQDIRNLGKLDTAKDVKDAFIPILEKSALRLKTPEPGVKPPWERGMEPPRESGDRILTSKKDIYYNIRYSRNQGDIVPSDREMSKVWKVIRDPQNPNKVAGDAADMVENILNMEGSPEPLRWAARFLLSVPHVSTPVEFSRTVVAGHPEIRGLYLPYTGAIRLSPQARDSFEMSLSVLHETMHAATLKYMSRIDQKVFDRVVDVYERIKMHPELLSMYGASADHEMTAEMANPMWRMVLEDVGYLDAVRDVTFELVNIPRTQELKNAPLADRFIINDAGSYWQIIEKAGWTARNPFAMLFGQPAQIPGREDMEIGILDKSEYPQLYNTDQVMEMVHGQIKDSYYRTKMPIDTRAQRLIAASVEPPRGRLGTLLDSLERIRTNAPRELATQFLDRFDPLATLHKQAETEAMRNINRQIGALTSQMIADPQKYAGNRQKIDALQRRLDEESYKIEWINSPYWAVVGMGGREGLVKMAYSELEDIMRPRRKHEGLMKNILLARRMAERNDNGWTNPQGITKEWADMDLQEVISKLTPEQKRDLGWYRGVDPKSPNAARPFASPPPPLIDRFKFEDEFRAWSDKWIMKPLLEANVISRNIYESNKTKNFYWLPFDTADSADIAAMFNVDARNATEDYVGIVNNAFMTARGMSADKRIKDPWEAILRRVSVAINFAERNRALMNLVKIQNTSPWAKSIIRRLHPGTDVPPGMGSFGVVINGRVVKYSAPMDIVKSLQTLTPKEGDFIDRMFKKQRSLFTLGTTGYYLPFSIYNLPRDLQMAVLMSKHKFNVNSMMHGIINGVSSAFGFPTKLYKDYLMAHAGMGGFTQRGAAEKIEAKKMFEPKWVSLLKSVANPPKIIANALKSVGTSFELGTRLGVFYEAQKANPDTPAGRFRAGMESRRSTIDFFQSGAAVKAINNWVPFFNASIQAKRNMFAALFSDTGVREGQANVMFGHYADPRTAAWTKAWVLMGLPALTTYFYNRVFHNEEYEKLDDEYKNNYIPFILGAGQNERGESTVKWVPLPKDDFLKIFVRPIEHFLDWAWKQDPAKWNKVALEFLSSMSPIDFEKGGKFNLTRAASGFMPPMAKAVVEPLAGPGGYDMYWGRPVIRDQQLLNASPAEQYTKNTPEIYKWIGEKVKASPELIRHGARQMFGNIATTTGPGSMAERLKSRVLKETPTRNIQVAYDWRDKAMRGYTDAKLKALRLLDKAEHEESPEYKQAMALAAEWNAKAEKLFEEMGKALGQEIPWDAPIRKQYTFDDKNWQTMADTVWREKTSSIEKQTGITIK